MDRIEGSRAEGIQKSPIKDEVALHVPKELSDIEFAKLKFPQPFMDRLGVPLLSEDIPKTESRIYIPSEQKIVSIPLSLESDKYKVTRTSSVLIGDDNLKQDVATEIQLKHLAVNVQISGNIPARLPEQIAKQTSDALELVKKQTGITPTQVNYITNSGYIKFTHEGQEYLASDRFVLKESNEAKIAFKIEEEIKTNSLTLEEYRGQLGDIKTRDQYSEKQHELTKRVNALGKEVNGGFLFSLDFESHDDSSYSPKNKEEFKNLKNMSSELREAESTLDKISEINSRNEFLNNELPDFREYAGTNVDGEVMLAKFSEKKSQLDIYDEDINGTGEEHTASGKLECQQYLPDGNKFTVKIPLLDPNESTTKVLEDSENTTITREEYNSQGELLHRSNNRLGYSETFMIGQLTNLNVFAPVDTLMNIEEVSNCPNGELALLEALKLRGMQSLKEYNELRKVMPDREDLIEIGLTKLNLSELQNLHKEVLESKEKEDSSEIKTTKLLDTLEFRIKMIQDGSELSRDDSYDMSGFIPGAHIWNDPRTRGYFEIKDSWINWEIEKNKVLLNKDDPELSKKEFKLLVARLLFDRREEINEGTVNEALMTIKKLRDNYSSTDVITGRNIVFAANSETLSREFHGLAEDSHSFGRRKLIEGIEERRGVEGSFNLVRDEKLILQNFNKITEVINENIDDKVVVSLILQDLQSAAKQMDSIYTDNNLKDVLIKHHVSSEAYTQITSDLTEVPEVTLERLTKIKKDLLDKIVNTPGPFTFIFDGHGSSDAIYLSDGQLRQGLAPAEVSSTIKVSSEEFAQAMIDRQGKWGSNSEQRDVYIFQECLNSNFIDKVDQKLGNAVRPIIISSAEYNQFSYYSYSDKYGSRFLSDVILGIKNGDGDIEQGTNIENIINRQFLNLKIRETENYIDTLNTNPGIYVPNEKGELIQISVLDRHMKNSYTV